MAGALALRPPRWLPPTSLVLSVLGAADAAYLTFEHYTGSTSLACSDKGTVDCTKVTTSQWSHFLGMPVALLGLIFFVVMVLLCLPQVWRRAPRVVDAVRLVGAAGGLVMVFYLVWAEFFKIHAICLWCTGVHILTFVLFFTLVFGEILRKPAEPTA
ncbi:vitamin K epoxide reductase family protein [Rudaeicoccus suwonensis]|uniref:Vitamin K epoxide reductase family protein n=1 Tax=Rudaeicoccus suwonensis TaxID=657409 RepID=A0A561E9I6_9MICO|nr:vitamin K epoxide reductase family protein [Rudaeicoccus suwonensis]TWE12272.1 vitamin K epoxide reductase family protein [Rudaeicoccus suwonensis]